MPMNRDSHGQRGIHLAIVLAFLLLGSMFWARSSAAAEWSAEMNPDAVLIVRIYYDKVSDLNQLSAYDVWEYNNQQEHYVLAAVDYIGYLTLLDSGWHVETDQEIGARLNNREKLFTNFYGGYRTAEELYADLQTMNLAAPDLSELVQYGQSHCLLQGGCAVTGDETLPGFPLLAMRVTNEQVPGSSVVDGNEVVMGSKPVFFLMANIHAREITTPEIAMRFLELLLNDYGNDPDITWLVDYHEIWVVPTTNPDGHWVVELGDRQHEGRPFLHRKNANNDSNNDGIPDCTQWPPTPNTHFGIDLNRNHSFGWGPIGASDEPCDATFHGKSAASESETQALESLISALIPDQRGPELSDAAPDDTTGILITLHSYSNLVLWPWGDRDWPAPNVAGLKAIGDKLATFNGYQSCQAGPCLYPTSGATDDWAYGELGIPAFTFEIGDYLAGFQPPFETVESTQWPENKPALLYAAKIARAPYEIVRGPVVSSLGISQNSPLAVVTATIDDSSNGDRPIIEAIATIDIPPWEDDAVSIQLEATDGVFDNKVEEVAGSIVPEGLEVGRHMLFVQGRNQAGDWGAVSAAFFEVPVVRYSFVPLVTGK